MCLPGVNVMYTRNNAGSFYIHYTDNPRLVATDLTPSVSMVSECDKASVRMEIRCGLAGENNYMQKIMVLSTFIKWNNTPMLVGGRPLVAVK